MSFMRRAVYPAFARETTKPQQSAKQTECGTMIQNGFNDQHLKVKHGERTLVGIMYYALPFGNPIVSNGPKQVKGEGEDGEKNKYEYYQENPSKPDAFRWR